MLKNEDKRLSVSFPVQTTVFYFFFSRILFWSALYQYWGKTNCPCNNSQVILVETSFAQVILSLEITPTFSMVLALFSGNRRLCWQPSFNCTCNKLFSLFFYFSATLSRFALWLHAICRFNPWRWLAALDIHHAKNTTSLTIMLHPPVHCFHGSPPESTHDAQRYGRHCLCSNNSCNKCSLRRNSHSKSGLLLLKLSFTRSRTLNECWDFYFNFFF